MSDTPASALNAARYAGYVTVAEMGPQGMITIRGNLRSTRFKKAVADATGLTCPKQRRIERKGDIALAWMSPDELMVMCPHADAPALAGAVQAAMEGMHSLVQVMSDARAMFSISGADAREVLAKLAPVDLSPDAFGPGDLRRTRLAQVAAAFWMEDAEEFRLICFRSVAGYAYGVLTNAARPGGEVGYF